MRISKTHAVFRSHMPWFSFSPENKNRFTLEIKLHTPSVKLRLLTVTGNQGRHEAAAALMEHTAMFTVHVQRHTAFDVAPSQTSDSHNR